jgi:hypothetical protein
MKTSDQTIDTINYDILADIEIVQTEPNKSIYQKYSELCELSLSGQSDSDKSVSGFFEKLYLSHHLSSLYGVYGTSSNG